MKINSRKLALVSLILSYSQLSAGAENTVKQDTESGDTLIVTASGREEQQRIRRKRMVTAGTGRQPLAYACR